jgi:hypothetical protein
MARCDVQIVLDRPDRKYRGGEKVTGSVMVEVTETVRCRALTLERYWQTHGRGNRASGGRYAGPLFEGEWAPGTYVYPFEFIAPASPLTYYGHYLNIDHYLHARADIPWSSDPRSTIEFVVEPGGVGGNDEAPLPDPVASGSDQQSAIGGAIFASILLVFGVIFLVPCGIVLIPAAVAIFFLSMRNRIARTKLGEVTVLVGGFRASPGERLPIDVTIARADAKINGVTVKLIGREVCVSGSGTNKSTHKHDLHTHQFTLETAPRAGELKAHGEVELPLTQAYSFASGDNKITWELEVRVDVPNWFDWVRSYPILLTPPDPAKGRHVAAAAQHAPDETRFDESQTTKQQAQHVRDSVGLIPAIEGAPEWNLPATPPVPPRPSLGEAVPPPPPPPPPPAPMTPLPMTPTLAKPGPASLSPGKSQMTSFPRPLVAENPPAAAAGSGSGSGVGAGDAPSWSLNQGLGAMKTTDPWALPSDGLGATGGGVKPPPPPGPSRALPELPALPEAPALVTPVGTEGAKAGAGAGAPVGAAARAPVPSVASPTGPRAAAPAAQRDEAALLAAVKRFATADRYGGQMQSLAQEMQGSAFRFKLTVERVDSTFGFGMAEPLRRGRTAVGKLADGSAVCVRFPEPRNAELDACRDGGKTVVAVARFREWNTLYDRMELDAEA